MKKDKGHPTGKENRKRRRNRSNKILGVEGSLTESTSPKGNTKPTEQPEGSTTKENKPKSENKEHYQEKWGTKTQGTHSREGETGHGVSLNRKTKDTQKSQSVSTKLQRIAQMAKENPEMVFFSIAHLIDIDWLHEAYRRTRKDAAAGASGTTAQKYAENLEENLKNLHQRLREGKYKAPPVKRVWIDKEDGSKRALGVPEFEDKVLQVAFCMLLEAIYEQDFLNFSHGFRKGHSAHKALKQVREYCLREGINFIVDADIMGFFDNLDKSKLIEIVKLRVKDGAAIRMLGKWFNAGVIDGENLFYPEKRISPRKLHKSIIVKHIPPSCARRMVCQCSPTTNQRKLLYKQIL